MKTYFVKQKFRLGGERFDIKDDQGRVAYQVEGSFFKVPKTFTIFGEDVRLRYQDLRSTMLRLAD